MPAQTKDQVNQRLIQVGSTVRLISEHFGSRDNRNQFECKDCGHVFTAASSGLANGRSGCPRCGLNRAADKTRLTPAEIGRRLAGRNIQLLTEIKTMQDSVEARCLTCGNEWKTKANGLLRATKPSGCRPCAVKAAGLAKRLSHEQVQEQIAAVRPEIVMTEPYQGDGVRIRFRCLIDGCEWITTPSHVKNDTGCPECAKLKETSDSVENLALGTLPMGLTACSFYIYDLANFSGFVKPGIANNVRRRFNESKGEYGDLLAAWDFETRYEALALELVYLQATLPMKSSPEMLDKANWNGVTELRQMDSEAAVAFAQELVDEMQEKGWQQFLLDHYPLPRRLVRALQGELVAA